MAKVLIGETQFELVLEEKVIEKAKQLHVGEDAIRAILQNNQEALQESENEEVLIMGNPTLTFIKTSEKIVVTNLIGQQNIF